MPQNIGKSNQDGQSNPTGLQLIDELFQIDRAFWAFIRMNRDVPLLVDREVILPPVVDVEALD
jgi:hypothetical protein